MARLGGDDYQRWVAAFTDAFADRNDLDFVVKVATDRALAHFVPDAGLAEQIEILIRKADETGWLRPLLAAALAKQPDRQLLRTLSAELEVLAVIEPDDPIDAMRIFGDPMFDRKDFRAALRALRTDGAPPVLLVHGDRYSGKSWSIRLVSYVARKKQDMNHVFIDLKDFEGKPVDAETLGRLIADQVDFKKEPPKPNEEMDSQWIRQYCGWLGRELKAAAESSWIIIDHLERVVLAESAKDFLYGLGKEIVLSMPMVRLIILSYDDPPALAVGIGTIARERIPTMTMDEIRGCLARFFAAEYLARERAAGGGRTQQELQQNIAESTEAVLGEINDKSPQRLVQMGEAVRKELSRT